MNENEDNCMQFTSNQQAEESNITKGVLQLVASVARLRSPIDGCLWFRRQTFQSLRRYLLEEVYEVLEPLDSESSDGLKEELGDLLFQIIVLTQLASEQNWFSLAEVLSQINEKIVHRSPHVFGDMHVNTVEAAQQIWREQKSREKMDLGSMRKSPLDGLSTSMPALALAQTYLERCSGFDTSFDLPYSSLKFDLETALLANSGGMESSVGKLLFMVVTLASRYHVDAEAALRKINAEFRQKVCEPLSTPSEKA
jgi:nucleoside triphosphate diphosphatase